MRSTTLLLALVASAAAVPTAAQEAATAAHLDSAATIAAGRKYTEWFFSDMGDSLLAHSSAQVREKVTAAQLSEFQAQLLIQAGGEVDVLSETVVVSDTLSSYLRETKFELMEEPLVVIFSLGPTTEIYGFFIRPKSTLNAADPS